MQMPAGVPDYSQFMQMSPSQRKNLLKMLKFFSGKQVQPLLMVVYEKDPDPEVRKAAREMLESQGVQIRVEGDNLPADAAPDSTPDWMRAASTPAQSNPNIAIPVTDDLSRRAADSLKRGQGTQPAADSSTSSSPGQSLSDAGATVYYTTEGGTFESPYSGADTIDGGDGRVMQRTQTFPQVFLLHPKNLKYVRGESERPTNSTFNPWVIALFLVLFSAAALWIFDLGSFITVQVATIQRIGLNMGALIRNPLIISLGVVALIILVSGWAWSYNARIMKRLAGDGTLLLGQILIVNGRWVTSGSGKNRSRSYKVTVAYRLRLPDGRLVDGQQTATRGDFARKALPIPGTPVAVLYVSDADKMLL